MFRGRVPASSFTQRQLVQVFPDALLVRSINIKLIRDKPVTFKQVTGIALEEHAMSHMQLKVHLKGQGLF